MRLRRTHLICLVIGLAAVAVAAPIAQASTNSGSVGLARGILETQFGFSPSQAADWTTGVCSYQVKPGACYLTRKQAAAQSQAEAIATGATRIASPPAAVAAAGTTGAFSWGDAGIGAAATLGAVMLLLGVGSVLLRSQRRQPTHA